MITQYSKVNEHWFFRLKRPKKLLKLKFYTVERRNIIEFRSLKVVF